MRRRDFILAAASAALWSRKADGQQASPTISVTKLELVINAKIAKSLDITIPLPLLGLAEVLE